MIHSTNHYQCA